jgi:phage shock protein PspC (stress-responsive transcriptional regulator)
MDKTININLGGTLFQVDEEAFVVLRDYLQAINTRFGRVKGGPETVEDIEYRIAEIFRSQRGTAGVISRQNVDSMISIIGKPEDFDLDGEEEEHSRTTFDMPAAKRLYRNPDDTVISGVCGGLGAYFSTDPVLFRILFILFTIFGGIGLLIYIALWIAVPPANSIPRKKEMYGKNYNPAYNTGVQTSAGGRLGNGINEITSALGRVFFVIFRIFMIVFGIILVVTGFLFILSFIMVFVFKFPGAFSHEGLSFNIGYIPEMLKFVVTPSVAPWITFLTSVVFILPMLALIYWGIRMIFWFRARDRYVNLAAFLIWIAAAAALSIIMFSEGISFAESSVSLSKNYLNVKPDTLYVTSGNKIANLKFDQKFSIPDDDYTVFLVDSLKQIYVKPHLRLAVSDDDKISFDIKKRSSGRSREEARDRSEAIVYNYHTGNDTIYFDEYFKIPQGKKWSADFVTINLQLPENTIIYFDRSAEKLFYNNITIERHEGDDVYDSWDDSIEPSDLGGKYWQFTHDGLKNVERSAPKHK